MNGYRLFRSLLKHILLGRGRSPVYVLLDDWDLEDLTKESKRINQVQWEVDELAYEHDQGNPFLTITAGRDS